MIISLDSPMRRLPTGMDKRQVLFIDGIRYSVEMVDLAYSRLLDTLSQLVNREDTNQNTSPYIVSAMLDAWAIVDSTHRLRELLQKMSRLKGVVLKKKIPDLQLFNRKTENVRKLRNYIQHLHDKDGIDKLSSSDVPVWGTLSWLSPDSRFGEFEQSINCYMIVAGTYFKQLLAQGVMIDFEKDHEISQISKVSLQVGNISFELEKTIRYVTPIVRMFENSLQNQFGNQSKKPQPYSASDAFFSFSLVPASECEPSLQSG